MTQMKLRLDFLFTDLSRQVFWNIFDGLCTQAFYASAWSKRWLEVICVIKSKAIQLQPKYKTRNFQNLKTKNKLEFQSAAWFHHKHYETAEFLIFFPSNSSITLTQYYDVRQWFGVFYECSAECVNLCHQEEQCTSSSSSSCGDNKK